MVRWTNELCRSEALKYSRKSDWYRAHQASYAAAQRNGWFDSCITHMTSGNFIRTKEQCANAAKKFTTRGAFKKGDHPHYKCAQQKGWLDECCTHMIAVKVRWTLSKCLWVAAGYQHVTDWKDRDQSSYNSARLNGWFDECSAHMTRPINDYDLAGCRMSAARFTCPSDWRRGDEGAYKAAIRNWWLSECTSHMTRKTGPSVDEQEVFDYILSLAPDAFQSDRFILGNGRELDIVVPSRNVAIEFNGLIWHSTMFRKDPRYHQDKSDAARAAGFRLIHIWGDEWQTKREWCKAFLRSVLLGADRKIMARKCRVVEIDAATAAAHHVAYHLQGTRAGRNLGLYSGDELVAVATVAGGELARWTVKFGVVVVGGLSKVMRQFGERVISFCDTAKHDGAGYLGAGFVLESKGVPTFWYTDGCERKNRVGFQKHMLLTNPDAKGETERDLAASIGFHRIYGCRQARFIWYSET